MRNGCKKIALLVIKTFSTKNDIKLFLIMKKDEKFIFSCSCILVAFQKVPRDKEDEEFAL